MLYKIGKSIKNFKIVNKTNKLHKAGMKKAPANINNMQRLKRKTIEAVKIIFQLVYDFVLETQRLLCLKKSLMVFIVFVLTIADLFKRNLTD